MGSRGESLWPPSGGQAQDLPYRIKPHAIEEPLYVTQRGKVAKFFLSVPLRGNLLGIV